MYRYIPFFLLLFIGNNSVAQSSPTDLVQSFFTAMNASDTSALRSMVSADAVLLSRSSAGVQSSTVDDLIDGLARIPAGALDERIYNPKQHVDGTLATVQMDYVLYYQTAFSHCGVNVFTLADSDDGWQVIHIADSRHPEPCAANPADSVAATLDRWHLAAAEADSETYFDLFTKDAVFVGTDKSEVWSKQAFYDFAQPYFDKGKAWAFTADSRNVYLHSASLAYFDEVLSTWMGPCRGSGVVAYDANDGKWRIKHYVLSMTIPNEEVDQVLEVIGIEKDK